MRFVLKAIFFLAVVAAFLPRQPEAEAAPRPAAAEPAVTREDVADARVMDGAASAFCDRRPALCQTAEESAFAFRVVGDIAMAQARQMILEAAAEPAEAPLAEAPASEDTPAP